MDITALLSSLFCGLSFCIISLTCYRYSECCSHREQTFDEENPRDVRTYNSPDTYGTSEVPTSTSERRRFPVFILGQSSIKTEDFLLRAGPEMVEARIECCICCQEYLSDDIILFLACGHLYHDYCLSTWMQQNQRCPMCRKKIVMVQIT